MINPITPPLNNVPDERNEALAEPVSCSSDAAASRRKVIVAASLGNALEMFDFTVFSFFAAIIGHQFFPVDSASGQLLLALGTFGVGFLARPLGGVLIGGYADRSGRKAAMTLTIGLMTLGTGVIACSPTYAQIGLAAPVLIVIGRLLQGFSAGGEIGASTTYLMESGTSARRGFMVSWQMISQGVSTVLGALCGVLLSSLLSHDSLLAWGWRVPFVLGLLIGPVGLYIRNNLDETHTEGHREQSAFGELMREYSGRLIHGVLMILGGTTSMYILGYYMPLYAVKTLHLPQAASFLAGCAAGIALIVGGLMSGQLVDRMRKRKPLLCVTAGSSFLMIYPLFALINQHPSVALLVFAAFITVLVGTVGSAAFFLLILELFPRHLRTTGLSIVYAFGVTLFGGFAQFNVTWLLRATGDPMSLAWYLMATGGISFVALLLFREAERQAD